MELPVGFPVRIGACTGNLEGSFSARRIEPAGGSAGGVPLRFHKGNSGPIGGAAYGGGAPRKVLPQLSAAGEGL